MAACIPNSFAKCHWCPRNCCPQSSAVPHLVVTATHPLALEVLILLVKQRRDVMAFWWEETEPNADVPVDKNEVENRRILTTAVPTS